MDNFRCRTDVHFANNNPTYPVSHNMGRSPSEQMTTTDQIGRVLAGRYRLEVELGHGTSAQVWRAFDQRLTRTVAVKLLHPGLVGDEEFLRRFRTEARLVAQLNHRHVLRVFDWGEEPDGPFLVGEYLAGGSLRDVYNRTGRLEIAQAVSIGIAASHGLAYAHRRGLVHRDIKPANLLFDEEGEVRIADFGLARALAEAAWTEPGGAVLGTARYASPEQASGMALDGRSDVYSLALVLYEAVTGHVPFSADTVLATLQARVGQRLPPARPLGALYPLLAEAAMPDPLARLQAGEFALELELLAGSLERPEPLAIAREKTADRRPPSFAPRQERLDWPLTGDEKFDESRGSIGIEDPTLRPDDTVVAAARPVWQEFDEAPARRPRRALRIAIPLLMLVVAAAGALTAYKLEFARDRVPSLVGLSSVKADAELHQAGLVVQDAPSTYSLTVPAGSVVSERPLPGTSLRHGSVVAVTLSRGPSPVVIPESLAGQRLRVAEERLTAVHLGHTVARSYSETVPNGVVLSAAPSSGTLNYGSRVALTVSRGPSPRTVPAGLVGTPWTSVSSTLSGLKLIPAENLVYSSTVASGVVMSTNPVSSTTGLKVGTHVEVTVSRGPQYVAVPAVASEGLATAVAQLRALGLTVSEVIGPPFATTAVTTNPAPGTSVAIGSAVTVYAS